MVVLGTSRLSSGRKKTSDSDALRAEAKSETARSRRWIHEATNLTRFLATFSEPREDRLGRPRSRVGPETMPGRNFPSRAWRALRPT